MGNPLLPLDEYIPDVEARVFTGSDGRERLFLYGSHDEYDMGTWCSYKYHVYSAPTEALDEWTDHGVSLASRTGEGYVWNGEECDGVPWKDALLYAPDVIQIEGRYWLASCFSGGGLGMSVSDRAEGRSVRQCRLCMMRIRHRFRALIRHYMQRMVMSG